MIRTAARSAAQSLLLAVSTILFSLILTGCGGQSSNVTAPKTLASIHVTANYSSIPEGATQQLSATATYTDGSVQQVTDSVTWSSSNTAVATVGTSGLVKAQETGTVIITAGSGSLSSSANLTITEPIVLSIQPTSATLTIHQTQTFQAVLQHATDDTLDWDVDGVPGGNDTLGTISSSGVYTPPPTGGPHQVNVTSQQDTSKAATAQVVISDYPGTYTYHYDNARTGQNPNERILSPGNLDPAHFGKLFSYPVDGHIFAQPLYVEGVQIPGIGTRNVIYVATEHDSVYAFDADGKSPGQLWHVNFLDPQHGVNSVACPQEPESCISIGAEVGITSTPVIDPSSGTLYVCAFTNVNEYTWVHKLHALDITTGAEKFGGPVLIQASISGSGYGSVNGTVAFQAYYQLQRSGLLLLNGTVYIAFSSFGDSGPYHGWLLGYDAKTLQQVAVFNTTPDGYQGAIWQSGGAPAADADGNIFLATANGLFDASSGGRDYGDSVIKLGRVGNDFIVADYFTPFNQAILDVNDYDLGSGGVVLLPDQSGPLSHLLVSAGKEGRLYLLNRDNLGRFNASGDTQIMQSIPYAVSTFFSTPAYWQGNLYLVGPVHGFPEIMVHYKLSDGHLALASQTSIQFDYPGGVPVISVEGSASNPILWLIESSGGISYSATPAILHAFDANDLSRELYNTTQAGKRDVLGPAVKFSVPTIANGKVYIGTRSEVDALGPLPQ
jgi:hypothetical protein